MTQKVEIIGKKEFATMAFNKEDETFLMQIATLGVIDLSVHLF